MVERQRIQQCQQLEARGWVTDETCRALQQKDERVGGPTYMRSPEGRYYAVACGQERLLEPQPEPIA